MATRMEPTMEEFRSFGKLLAAAEADGSLASGVLILRLPSLATIEPRTGHLKMPKALSCEVSNFTATPLEDCFEIGRHPKNGRWTRKHLDNPEVCVQAPLELKGFLETLQNEALLKKVRYAVDLDPTDRNRQFFRINQSPLCDLEGNTLVAASPKVEGIHTPFLYSAGDAPGAPFAIHVEDYGLYSLNFLHLGAPKNWVIVRPTERAKLEDNLRRYYSLRFGQFWTKTRCSQFARHLSLWVPPALLEDWGVQYTMVEQRPGDLVITAPDSYHQGWNSGWNVAEAVNYAGAKAADYARGYQPCFRGCYPNPDEADPQIQALRQPLSVTQAPIQLHWQSNNVEEA